MRKPLQLLFIFFIFFQSNVSAQTAQFTQNSFPLGVPYCEGVTLIFNDASTGNPTSWNWDFGVGAVPQTSTQQNPGIVSFPICGTYNVQLTLNNGSTVTHVIVIHCNPTACFTVTPPTACLGATFSFQNCSTPAAGNTYLWDFGNGDSTNLTNPTYQYAIAQCYTVGLIATTSFGCSDFIIVPNSVCITPPPTFQINSTISTTCQQNLCVSYTCSNPVGGAPPYSYAWTFSGGAPNSSNVQNPTNICYTTGSYPVSLTVSDANGCSSSITLSGYVNVGNNLTFINLTNDTVCVGHSIVASTTPASSYAWSITPTVGVTPNTPQTTATVNYSFSAPGIYTITLVDTVNGCGLTTTSTIHVFPQPVASFTVNTTTVCAPPTTATVAYNGPAPVAGTTFLWSFPGGTPSTYSGTTANPNPPTSISYSACGHYGISLTVTAPGGCDSTLILNDTVKIDCPIASYDILNLPLPGHFCPPIVLNFDATGSTGNPTNYSWCIHQQGTPFPCSYTTTGALPAIAFNSPGCYDITLTTTNAQGCTATVTNDFTGGQFCLGVHITPCFTATPLVTCAPVPVLFDNCSTPNPFPVGTTWLWNFGDGGTSTVQTPQHLFHDTSCYTIFLVATNYGCSDTLTIPQYVCILPPIPQFTYTINCDSPNVVLFDMTGSIGADHITWSFPGGTPSTSTDSIIYVTYPMPAPNASHPVQLLICNDSSQCCDSTSQTVFLRVLQAIATVDTSICFPSPSDVTNTSIGGGNAYVWKVYDSCNGGAQVLNSGLDFFSSNTGPIGHINYPGPGKYHVVMRAISLTGCEDTLEWDVNVYGLNPDFFGDTLSGCAPITVTFTDTTNSNCISHPVSYSYNFGDGPLIVNSATGIVTHTYTTNGSFTVTEWVTDQTGCVSVDSTVAYVNTQVPTVSFYAPDTTICLGTQICFQNNSSGTNLSYQWNFGDATTSNSAFPCHTYLNTGTYTVTLTATDQFGCSSTLIKPNYIIVGQVNGDFAADTTFSPCPPLVVTFYPTPSNNVNGCLTYYWSFGDGTFSTIDTPLHIYGYAGTFTVSLTVTDICSGCSDTIIKTNYITLQGPFSNPIATPDTACVPQLVQFDLAPTNSISFLWDFDDSSPLIFTSVPDTNHLYNVEGTYFPSVAISDGTCTYSRIIDTIVILIPHPAFTSSTNNLCSGGIVDFTDASTALGGVTGWLWNFGDNTTSNQQNPSHTYNAIGDFVVTLTIFTHACPDSISDTIHVTASPTALFIPPATGNCPGAQICFTADTVGSSPVCTVHWDFGDGNSSTLFNPCNIYAATGTYTVTYIAYGCNGCNDTAISSVTINPLPVANAGPDQSVCNGDSVMLHGQGGSPLWSPPGILSNPTGDSTLVFPTSDTTVTLIVTDANGCVDTDYVAITLVVPPSANINAGDTICFGSSYTFTATGGTVFLWSTGDTTATITVSPTVTTTYTVTVSGGACGDDTFAVVYVLPPPPVDAGPHQEFCIGDSTQLAGSGAQQYLWNPSATLSDSTINNPFAFPTATATYTLLGTDSLGCTASDTVSITVHLLPIVDAGPDRKICDSTCTQLIASGAFTYVWNPDVSLFSTTVYNPIACPLDTTMFYVTGTDQFGCVSMDSVKVEVLKRFTTTFPPDFCICLFESDTMCASGSTINFFHWSPPVGLSATNIPCPIASPTTTTTYTIIISDELSCFADTGDVVVCVNPLPVVTASPDVSILDGTTTTLTGYNVLNPGTGNYVWTPDTALSCTNCMNTDATPLQTTSYVVTLTDANGCKDDDTVLVTVYCNDAVLFVPNAFSPGDDDDLNKEFKLAGIGISELHFLRIFNRWGEMVFETEDFNQGWDGKVKGKLSEPEVFVYYLEAVCSTGEIIRKQGNITLIR